MIGAVVAVVELEERDLEGKAVGFEPVVAVVGASAEVDAEGEGGDGGDA